MTGGGFGGCTVSLVQPRYVDTFTSTIEGVYQNRYNIHPTVFATTATAGVSVLE
jgi:galactokinase